MKLYSSLLILITARNNELYLNPNPNATETLLSFLQLFTNPVNTDRKQM
jgi:hypothetical protein